ncbi:hypothetical protein [Sphaerospermopsis sp. FACHB-1194]|nr:hypothetical protein [Sphaerospermopsis sp. FACHB-1194]
MNYPYFRSLLRKSWIIGNSVSIHLRNWLITAGVRSKTGFVYRF